MDFTPTNPYIPLRFLNFRCFLGRGIYGFYPYKSIYTPPKIPYIPLHIYPSKKPIYTPTIYTPIGRFIYTPSQTPYIPLPYEAAFVKVGAIGRFQGVRHSIPCHSNAVCPLTMFWGLNESYDQGVMEKIKNY